MVTYVDESKEKQIKSKPCDQLSVRLSAEIRYRVPKIDLAIVVEKLKRRRTCNYAGDTL
jgi:hypothetical protein